MCLWLPVACVCVRVCALYTKPRQQKFRAMNGAIWQAQLGESLVMLMAPAGNPIYCPIGHQIWGPLGKQDVCPTFALTAAKFLFSKSGNFRAKANPPSPGLALNAHSGNEWGKIPVLTGLFVTGHKKVSQYFRGGRNEKFSVVFGENRGNISNSESLTKKGHQIFWWTKHASFGEKFGKISADSEIF